MILDFLEVGIAIHLVARIACGKCETTEPSDGTLCPPTDRGVISRPRGRLTVRLSKSLRAIAVAASALGLCSCLLLFQGTTEQIGVASDPPGATVTLNNGETRVTPFTITVPREKDLQLHFSKAGYQSTDLVDNSQVEGLIIVDVIPLMIPWGIDASAGAGFAHQQTSLYAHLDPAAAAASDSPSRSATSSPQAVPKTANSDTAIAP